MLFDPTRKKPSSEPVTPEQDSQIKRHRNRMAGLWGAELLGLIGQAAHDYAREIARTQDSSPDDETVVGRLARDLHGKVTIHEIREKLAHLVHEARRQLLSGEKDR